MKRSLLKTIAKSGCFAAALLFLANNEQIVKFNNMLKDLAQEKNAVYLDVASVMSDENGNLPREAAVDGIHPGIEYYKKWAEYLKENAIIDQDT